MKTTIDSAGRVVIPKEIRREAGLRPEVPLSVRCEDGRVILEPAPTPVRIERRGRFAVAVPVTPVPELGEETVEETRRRLRNERDGEGPR